MKNILLVVLLIICQTNIFTQNHIGCRAGKSNFNSLKKSAASAEQSDTIDIVNYILKLDLTNFSTKVLKATVKVEFIALVNNVSEITFDFMPFTIDSVKQSNTHLSYTFNTNKLKVQLQSNLNQNQSSDIEIFYQGTPYSDGDNLGGFHWDNTYAYNIGVSLSDLPHSLGRAWFPCFDNFIEKTTIHYFITTKLNHKAFCNGVLLNETTNATNKIWEWQMNQKIPSYLAAITVAPFNTIEINHPGQNGNIPITLAALPSEISNFSAAFVNLPVAIDGFEESYGPYQFEKIGYCLTPFIAAMEHATNVTQSNTTILGGTTASEWVMAHELAHHWWGNLVTCDNPKEMWLNEGWAKYSEALFTEKRYGTEAYKNYIRKNHDNVLRLAHVGTSFGGDGDYYAVANVPQSVTYGATTYEKGSDIVHTIRGIMGDDDFFSCITSFLETNKFKSINSQSLETYLSSCSGKNLSSYFQTSVFEKGFHHFSFGDKSTSLSTVTNKYTVDGTIYQKLWENANFTTDIPLEISFFDENMNRETRVLDIEGECTAFSYEFDFDPVFFAIDFDEKIADATVDKVLTFSTTGNKDFSYAKLILDVNTISSNTMVRVTHNYIKPDPLETKIANLHLSKNRYWNIDGIWDNDFSANAIFTFNGTTNNEGFLDNDFITNLEDSIIMMYRNHPGIDWEIITDFTINTQGNNNNKRGKITVNNVKKGDYVMAIYDNSQNIDNSQKTNCLINSVENCCLENAEILVFPNPFQSEITISNSVTQVVSFKIINIIGETVYNKNVETNEIVNLEKLQKGIFILKIEINNKVYYSKLIKK